MTFYLCQAVEDGRVTLRSDADGVVLRVISGDDYAHARSQVIEAGMVHVPGHGWYTK